jgi:hypothetical protein
MKLRARQPVHFTLPPKKFQKKLLPIEQTGEQSA